MFNYKIVVPFVAGVLFYTSIANAQYNEAKECWFKKRVDEAFGHHYMHHHKGMEAMGHEHHKKSMHHKKKHKHKYKHHKGAAHHMENTKDVKSVDIPHDTKLMQKPAIEEHNEHSDKR